MTVLRGCFLLALFTALAIAVVHLRAEQTRCAASILQAQSERIRLRSELWSLQARIARARAPDRIHDRATYLATGLVPPGAKDPAHPRVERLAVDSQNRKNAKTRKPRNPETRN